MSATARLALPFPTSADTADVPRDIEALAERIEALTAWIRQSDFAVGVGVFASGDLKLSAVAVAPTGWLLCDGASYLRATWPDLFAAIGGAGSPWGLPDGTHFNVPDLRGQAPIGAGTGTGLTLRTLATKYGAETVQLTAAQVAAHTHNSPAGATFLIDNGVAGVTVPTAQNLGGPHQMGISNATGANSGAADQAHPNVQPSLAVNFFVKT